MHRDARERGAALILLLGIIATLAILASMLVFVLINEQGATAKERTRKQSAAYTEGSLDALVQYVKGPSVLWPSTSPGTSWALTPAQLNTLLSSLGIPPGAQVSYLAYDNLSTVNQSIGWDSNGDGIMWLQITYTYKGKTTRMRVMVRLAQATWLSALPRAVLFSDTNISANGTSDLYAVNTDLTPDTSGFPFPTSIMAGGNFTAASSSTNLAAPGTSVQSLSIKANGTVTTPGNSFQDVTTGAGTVGLLSDYFDQSAQADLGDEAQQGIPTLANASATSYSSLANLQAAMTRTGTSPNYTYTAAGDLKYSGNLTLNTSGTTYNFQSLYVPGNLTVTGNVTLNAKATYTGGGFTISGATTSITDQLGPTYVTGTLDWRGGSSGRMAFKTTSPTTTTSGSTVIASPTVAGPLYAKIFCIDGNAASGDNSDYDGSSGAYDLTLGNVWIDGDAGTGDIAVNFSAPSSGTASTVMCPLLATTEKTVSNGYINFGTPAAPMTYFMQCDNDGLYSNTCDWANKGTFYGLMVLMEAVINISGGDGTLAHPSIMGAIFEGTPYKSGTTASTSDITLSGKSTVAYNQAIIDKVANVSVRTTTTIVQIVPGSWQQLGAQ